MIRMSSTPNTWKPKRAQIVNILFQVSDKLLLMFLFTIIRIFRLKYLMAKLIEFIYNGNVKVKISFKVLELEFAEHLLIMKHKGKWGRRESQTVKILRISLVFNCWPPSYNDRILSPLFLRAM